MKYITLKSSSISGCIHQIERELGKSIKYFDTFGEPILLMNGQKVFLIKERGVDRSVKIEGDEFIIDSVYNDIIKG